MWMLPWERWLPPYVLGPMLTLVGLASLFDVGERLWIRSPGILIAACGAYGTWRWFKTRENLFNHEGAAPKEEELLQNRLRERDGSDGN